MRMRPGGWTIMSGMALTLAGCGDGKTPVARAAGTTGAVIEMPIPDASPSARATPGPSAPAGESVANADTPLATIGFAQGGAALSSEAKAALDRMAEQAAVKTGRLTLRGHSDSDGDDAANRTMSRKRAEAVREYLVRKGIARDRMTVIALGETRPVAPNAKPDGSDDSAGRARNRRVEIALAPAAA